MDKITKLLRQYPEIEQQFYGGLRSEEVAEVKVKLDAIQSAVAVIAPAAAASVKTEIDRYHPSASRSETQGR